MEKKTVIYISDYIDQGIIEERNIKYFSPAANNKILGIARSLVTSGYDVTMISGAWTKHFNNMIYPRKEINLEDGIKLIYTSFIDRKFYNILSTIHYKIKEVLNISKMSDITAIIFYNFSFHTFIPSIFLKYKLSKQIILEFEESFCYSISKNIIFDYILEKVGKHFIDSAILVTSLLKNRLPKRINTCVVRGFCTQTEDQSKTNKLNVKTVFYGGKWDEIRGIDIFVKSLMNIHNNVNITITGYGSFSEKLNQEVKIIQSTKKNININIFHMVKAEKYRELLNSADILVSPQKTKRKFSTVSFPSKIYEYMSFGKVIISSNISDIKQFASGKLIVYDYDDPMLLASKLDEILDNFDKYSDYGYNALQWVRDEGSYNKVGERIKALILKES